MSRFGYKLTVFVDAPGEPSATTVSKLATALMSAVDNVSPGSLIGPVSYETAVLFDGTEQLES